MTGLRVDGLRVGFDTRRGAVHVVDDVSVDVARGRTLGVVGESGSGKTTFGRALARHLPSNGRVLDGHISVDDTDVLALSPRDLRSWRARELAVVHQEAGATLDPSMRVGAQLAEVLGRQDVARDARRDRVRELLTAVRLPEPDAIARRYPHELSGGQQQRVVIAAALASRPSLLILDEPTTGLDASVEAEILALLEDLRRDLDATVVLISHDLGLVGQICDEVAVLYAGQVVERGAAADVLSTPRHPYTAALLASAPTFGVPRRQRRLLAIPGAPPDPAAPPSGCRFAPRCAFADDTCRAEAPAARVVDERIVRCHHAEVLDLTATARPGADAPVPRPGSLLQVDGLTRRYGSHAVVDDVSLDIAPGEVFGLVGESGSGKTTLARAVMGIGPRSGDGTLRLSGSVLAPALRRRGGAVLRRMQMVFQQPDTTLNPSHRVRAVLARAHETLHGTDSVETLAGRAQLDDALLDARSTDLSGGQKQRVAIARAFAGSPDLVVCDEPVSALDVSVQAGVLEVLADERDRTGTSYLFISHDLAVIGYLADRVGVMYRGQLVEVGATDDVLSGSHHPYTAALVLAAQRGDRRRSATPPVKSATATGCRFAARCPHHLGDICAERPPPLRTVADGHQVRCHLPIDQLPKGTT
jgi:peptide/nickel transport system ATP-binding protein